MSIFFDEKGKLHKELLAKEAEDCARQFVQEADQNRIKSTQLRRFYSDFKALERSLEQKKQTDEEAFSGILPLVKMARAKAEYAKGRKVVPQSFVDWLSKNVKAIHHEKDFQAFLLHFEAVLGFCYGQPGFKD